MRALLDKYDATTTVGEVGDAQRQLEIMSSYTSGGDKLHMAYTFDFLGGSFEAPYFRDCIAKLEAMVGNGWPCWAFSNHDVVRHLSRWAPAAAHRAAFAKLCASVLMTLRGSVCIYQGEELALGEAELAFDDLVDPYGIEFWPSFKGRDGCRTPMVWQSAAHLGGFSTAAKSWLPVAADHLAHAVDLESAAADSVLNHYRRLIGERRNHPALQKGSIELVDAPATVFAHIRRHGNESLLCAFNMSTEAAEFEFGEGPIEEIAGFGKMAKRNRQKIAFGPYEAWIGRIG